MPAKDGGGSNSGTNLTFYNVPNGATTMLPRMTIENTGNVGIGTTTMTNKLQVNGTVAATAFVGDGSGLTGVSGSASGWVDGGTNVYVSPTTDNVAIGTTTPSTKLHVVGGARITGLSGCDTIDTDANGVLACGTDDSGGGSGGWVDGGTNIYVSPTTDNVAIGTTTPNSALLVENLGTQPSFRVNDSASDTSPFVIGSSGNVGVGTIDPVDKFTVGGTGQFKVDSNGLTTLTSTTTTGDVLTIVNNSITSGNLIDVTTSSAGVTSPLISANASSSSNTTDVLRVLTAGTGYAALFQNTGSAGLIARFNDVTSDLTPMAIDHAGNVGIGTFTPVAEVDIRSEGTIPALLIGSSATDATGGFLVVNSVGNVGIGTTSALNNKLTVNGPIATTGSGNSYLNADGGNVGIGTSEPAFKLDLTTASATVDGMSIQNTNASSLGGMVVKNAAGNGFQMVATGASYALPSTYGILVTTGEKMHFGEADATLNMTIDGAGSVGIGTTSPRSLLEIDKGTGTAQITIDGTTGACLMLQDTDGAGWTECDALNGTLTCTTDADGICD